MASDRFILALDQGTTSSRAILFDHGSRAVAWDQREFPQIMSAPGSVEHDPEAIWESQLQVARDTLLKAHVSAERVAALGITNQRETTIIWDRQTGQPLDHAIVWQSRVTAGHCQRLCEAGLEPTFRAKTGLRLDPYFSGTKIQYLLDRHDPQRRRAARGDILFGTVDSYLIWRLTGGRCHVTDPSNASRTLLYDIHQRAWDTELANLLQVPLAMLPTVVDHGQVVGVTDASWFGSPIPIATPVGDQQAATFGQACFQPGSVKNTYGTGCFMLMNTGTQAITSRHQLLTTIGWVLKGQVTYCLEGSVFVAGAVVQWLRDGLGLIRNSGDVEALARTVPDTGGVVFVPALVGMGAPYWDPMARGTILGITRGTSAGHLARAAIESMAMQSHDLAHAMREDVGGPIEELKVDGGAARNDDLMQLQADILSVPVRRPRGFESTALGAAYLAGLAVGYWDEIETLTCQWALDREFLPQMQESERARRVHIWREAVKRSLGWAEIVDPVP